MVVVSQKSSILYLKGGENDEWSDAEYRNGNATCDIDTTYNGSCNRYCRRSTVDL